jgi:hypothetical protein
MTLFDDLQDNTKKAVKWIAAEFAYLKELKVDLERIEHAQSTNEEERAYNKVRHVWRYVAKCERRSEHNIQEVVEELKGAAQTYPNLRRLENQIEVPEAELVRAFSMYTGDFNKKLVFLSLQFRTKEKYFGDRAEQIDIEIKTQARELEHFIDTLIKWASGIEASLKQLGTELIADEAQKLTYLGDNQYSKPIMARFESVFRVERFLREGYGRKEGFLRESGDFPGLIETQEDQATRYMEQRFNNLFGVDPLRTLKMDGIGSLGRAFLYILDHVLNNYARDCQYSSDSTIRASSERNFDFGNFERPVDFYEILTGRLLTWFNKTFEIDFISVYLSESDRSKRVDKAMRTIKLNRIQKAFINEPEYCLAMFRLMFGKDLFNYALYDVIMVFDASKIQYRKGLTVSGATYFAASPNGLVAIHIIHRNPIFYDLIKRCLLKIGVTVPIY